MTPEEIRWVMNLVGTFGLGAIVACLTLYFVAQKHLGSYLTEKGKNLATKEDIEEITRLVEDVKHQNNELIEGARAKQQMRMAALDKRLQAHQEAFTYWRKLMAGNREGEKPVVIQCQDWWEQNCLYLEPNVRQAFVAAYTNAHLREQLQNAGANAEDIINAWNTVVIFPSILFETIQLPGLSLDEQKNLAPDVQES
jgi:hypothetical protein